MGADHLKKVYWYVYLSTLSQSKSSPIKNMILTVTSIRIFYDTSIYFFIKHICCWDMNLFMQKVYGLYYTLYSVYLRISVRFHRFCCLNRSLQYLTFTPLDESYCRHRVRRSKGRDRLEYFITQYHYYFFVLLIFIRIK